MAQKESYPSSVEVKALKSGEEILQLRVYGPGSLKMELLSSSLSLKSYSDWLRRFSTEERDSERSPSVMGGA